MIKKLTAIVAVAAAFAMPAPAAQAQDYPNRLIKIIQGFPPGGNVDLISRILAAEMEKSLGQSIVVEAKPGLAGALAAETVARADADGYTLLVLPSAHPAYAALAKNVKFKVVDDFSWISVASFYPFMICVKADSRFKTMKQLVDEAKSKPGELKYGSAGVGSILHTTVELIGNQTNTKFLHVPYRGEAPALTGVLTGDVDFIASTTGPVSARLKSGEFRALAVTGKARWPDFPDVPTVAETILPNFEVISWTGMAAPANLPKPVVDKLNAELRKALAAPDVQQKLKAMGGDPRATTPDEMKALVSRQYETWKKLATEANLSIN
jgi:tripartite-type tricarboxylate transporter receptor subunit TctC